MTRQAQNHDIDDALRSLNAVQPPEDLRDNMVRRLMLAPQRRTAPEARGLRPLFLLSLAGLAACLAFLAYRPATARLTVAPPAPTISSQPERGVVVPGKGAEVPATASAPGRRMPPFQPLQVRRPVVMPGIPKSYAVPPQQQVQLELQNKANAKRASAHIPGHIPQLGNPAAPTPAQPLPQR